MDPVAFDHTIEIARGNAGQMNGIYHCFPSLFVGATRCYVPDVGNCLARSSEGLGKEKVPVFSCYRGNL